MKRVLYILLLFSFSGMTSCVKEKATDEQAPSQVPLTFSASIDDGTRTRGFGDTGYESTSFNKKTDGSTGGADAGISSVAGDYIGVFATITQPLNATPTRANIFYNYGNVGYVINGTGNAGQVDNPKQPTIKAPLFLSTHLDLYAFYPWPGNNQISSVVNVDDLSNIKFRLFQDQTMITGASPNINRCNIMRADPIKDQSYPTSNSVADQNARKVNFNFRHIMSLLEFHLSKDTAGGWNTTDQLLLDRIIVLGKKISTEGTFDLVGPTPNVQITTNPTTSNSSMYKTDPLTPVKADATTGATTSLPYLRRSVIIPPVPPISSTLPPVGEQGDVEFVISLRWGPAGTAAADMQYTNRHYIVTNMSFESGKKYIFDVRLSKLTPVQTKINITAQPANWDSTPTWSTTFD